MLPDPKTRHTCVCETRIGIAVSGSIAVNLELPEVPSGLRENEVLRAAVPETAVHEDVETNACEYNVGAPPAVERKWEIDAESHSGLVEQRTQGQFWSRVTAPIRLHRSPRGR